MTPRPTSTTHTDTLCAYAALVRVLPSRVLCGCYDGDDVIDSEGRSEVDVWSHRWRENGGCTMEGSTGPVEGKDLEKYQSAPHTPGAVYAASKIAWLVAALIDRTSTRLNSSH